MTLYPGNVTYPGSATLPGPDDLTGYVTSVGKLTDENVVTGQGYGPEEDQPIVYVSVAFNSDLNATPNWTDITPFVRAIDTRTGRNFELADFQAGTASITLDSNDGRFNPQRSDGPYVGYLTPMRRVRIFAAWNGTIYPIWAGFAEAWEPSLNRGGTDETVTLRAVDAFKLLNAKQYTTLNLAAARPADRIATLVNGLPGITYVSTGNGTVWCSAQVVDAPTSALSLVKNAAGADLGTVFCDASGRVRFEHRTYRSESETTDRVVFGDETGELSYTDAEFSYTDENVYTEVIVTASASFEASKSVLAEVSGAQAEYGRRTLQLNVDIQQGPGTSLPDTDPDLVTAGVFATALANRYQSAAMRLDEITIAPRASDAHYAAALSLRIGNRVRVLRRPAWGGVAASTSEEKVTDVSLMTTDGGLINQPVFIERVEHSIRPGSWVTKYGLSPATAIAYYEVPTSTLPSSSAALQTFGPVARYGVTERSLVLAA